jgi:hypothetical protein
VKHDGVSSPANSAVDTYGGHVHTLRHSGREGASDSLSSLGSAGAWCSSDREVATALSVPDGARRDSRRQYQLSCKFTILYI